MGSFIRKVEARKTGIEVLGTCRRGLETKRIIDLYRFYANLRMHPLPYIYNEAIYISTDGEPLMWPLFYDYPEDPRVFNIEDQYLFGRSLLVAPVIVEGARQRKIYLPWGQWTDFWTGKVYSGESYINYPCDLGKIPVFYQELVSVSSKPQPLF